MGTPTVGEGHAPDASAKAGEGTMPQSINLTGDIAGDYFAGSGAAGVRHGLLRHAAGSLETFDPPGSISTVAQSLSDSGEIVGNYVRDDVAHGFLREKDGTFVSFDPPGSTNTAPLNISAAGEVAGYYADDNETLRGFLRHKDGSIIEFDAPGASTNRGQGTFPLSINAQGKIAGYFYAGASGVLHGFLWGSDGTFTVFDPPGSAGESAHASPDREGYVVRPVTAPLSINMGGDIAGYFGDAAGVLHAFIRSSTRTFSVFEAANASTNGGLGTFAQAMNDTGAITSYYFDQAQSVRHGFLLKPPQNSTNPQRASQTKSKQCLAFGEVARALNSPAITYTRSKSSPSSKRSSENHFQRQLQLARVIQGGCDLPCRAQWVRRSGVQGRLFLQYAIHRRAAG